MAVPKKVMTHLNKILKQKNKELLKSQKCNDLPEKVEKTQLRSKNENREDQKMEIDDNSEVDEGVDFTEIDDNVIENNEISNEVSTENESEDKDIIEDVKKPENNVFIEQNVDKNAKMSNVKSAAPILSGVSGFFSPIELNKMDVDESSSDEEEVSNKTLKTYLTEFYLRSLRMTIRRKN